MNKSKTEAIDFAISYAGEDLAIAKSLAKRLRELSFTVFLADEQRRLLVGVEGEAFFERLFMEAKQVVTFISKSYVAKDWPRFEWDIIRRRDIENRYIPIRIDNTQLVGLPSKVLYVGWTGDNLTEVVDICVERLLLFERESGIKRSSLYDRILAEIQHGSRGALTKAYQLIIDDRKRTPLDDAPMPGGDWNPCYELIDERWHNYSKVRRRAVKVRLSTPIDREELLFNLKCCCVKEFNDYKPDAVSVAGYSADVSLDGPANLGVIEFAPFGDWGKAEEGVAYNLPTSVFEFRFLPSS